LSVASGRYHLRFCTARAAEVEWRNPVATAHGSVLRALRRLSGSIRSLPLTVLYPLELSLLVRVLLTDCWPMTISA
jgi:hypothetical protein